MSDFAYRFSIIPPGAIIDPRVTPRALQVLCLLGRHINDGGWCSRSQVKMARELGCSRSAVQEACEILVETGWVETRRNGRGGTGPDASDHPFAAMSYRVRIDRDDLPARVEDPPPQAVESSEGGAGIAAGGAGIAAGGAAQAAPLEGISSEGISSEPERETRAREHDEFARWLSAFTLRWPTAAADDQARIATAGRALTREQRKAALEAIPAFLEHLRKLGRNRVPAGWKYLEERRWEKLPGPDPEPAQRPAAAEGSVQWKIWSAVWVIARPRGGMPYYLLSGIAPHRSLSINRKLPDAMAWLADESLAWAEYPEGSNSHGAWRRWLLALMPSNLIENFEVKGQRAIRAPWPWPPKADGTKSEATGPPASAA